VSVEKKDSGKIRVCIDFRDLNKAINLISTIYLALYWKSILMIL